MFGTGLWLDFAKDIIPWSGSNDVDQFFRVLCVQGWRREIPARIIYTAAAAGFGVVVYRGYERTFDTPVPAARTARTPFLLPVVQTAF